MTAIAGFWSFAGEDAGERCGRMLKSQALYGPHHRARWGASPVALGRNLFRLLPEDIFDRGPVREEAAGLTLVADARLDNREELGRALGLGAESLRTLSDAALLMHSLWQWDEAALDRIVGDFAFALWDSRRQRLLLARDFLGQRPLHYHRSNAFFAFASMPKGLHALAEIRYAPNEAAAADFLALLPQQGTESFFEGVERVPPGHVVSVTQDGVRCRRYWQPVLTPFGLADHEYEEALREQLDLAVRSRLRGAGDVVATHLSGGLDSSIVAATAARQLAPAGGKLVAFTAVPRPEYSRPKSAGTVIADEGPLAAATAGLYPNIEHVRVSAGGTSPVCHLDRHFFLYERPVLNPFNAVWADAIHEEVHRRGIRVMLTGQAGNLSFSYDGLERLAELLGKGRLPALWRQALALKRGGMRWRRLAVIAFGPYLPQPLWRWFSARSGSGWSFSRYSALEPSAPAKFDIHRRAREQGLDFSFRPWRDGVAMRLTMLGWADMGNYNKGPLGGWQVDERDPTADRRLVEFCLRVPGEQFLLGGEPRSLPRRAFSDRLPQAVVQERRRGYQAADWHIGLDAARNEISQEVEQMSRCPPARELLDVQGLEKSLSEWPREGWNERETIQRYRLALLRGVAAGHFLRKASRSN